MLTHDEIDIDWDFIGGPPIPVHIDREITERIGTKEPWTDEAKAKYTGLPVSEIKDLRRRNHR